MIKYEVLVISCVSLLLLSWLVMLSTMVLYFTSLYSVHLTSGS